MKKKKLRKDIRTIFILLLVLFLMVVGIYFIVTNKNTKSNTTLNQDVNENNTSKDEANEAINDDGSIDDKKEDNVKNNTTEVNNNEEEKVENRETTKKEEPKTTTTVSDSSTTSKGFKIEVKNGITYIDGVLVVNKTYSLPSTYAPGLDSTVKKKSDEMFAAAKLDGLSMKIQSGFRSYDTQNRLYNNYVKSKGKTQADAVSARPGHSEHQSGLAFDVCESSGKYSDACINSNFDNTPEAKWLAKNAYKYGFILRFVNGKTNETGYKYESWHYRYVGNELAEKLYNNGDWITLESYFGIDSVYK